MKSFDFIVFGNNTGAIVAAIELGKTQKVAIINPTSNWGAHFAGVRFNGKNFDLGMNFFEFTSFHKPSNNLMSYNPEVRNDSARFFSLVEKFIKSRIDVTTVESLELFANNMFGEDLIVANNLDVLRKLPNDITEKIKSELEQIIKKEKGKLHASQKKLNEQLFLETSYFDVSIANHGLTFHNLFIEPMCKKIFNISSKDIPALFHRIAWAPLFYPETLLQAIERKEQLDPTIFHYPREGNFGVILDELMRELKSNNNITILSQKIIEINKTNQLEIKLENEYIYSEKLIWCSDLISFLQSTKVVLPSIQFQKASITILFSNVNSSNICRNFSCLNVCDNGPIYRITNQEFSAGVKKTDSIRLVVEYNYDYLNDAGYNSNEEILELTNQFLLQNKILKNPLNIEQTMIKTIKNAINLPTYDNINNYQKLLNLTLDFLPEVELIGPASGFVSTSFNDQIVQGLKLGVKYQ